MVIWFWPNILININVVMRDHPPRKRITSHVSLEMSVKCRYTSFGHNPGHLQTYRYNIINREESRILWSHLMKKSVRFHSSIDSFVVSSNWNHEMRWTRLIVITVFIIIIMRKKRYRNRNWWEHRRRRRQPEQHTIRTNLHDFLRLPQNKRSEVIKTIPIEWIINFD